MYGQIETCRYRLPTTPQAGRSMKGISGSNMEIPAMPWGIWESVMITTSRVIPFTAILDNSFSLSCKRVAVPVLSRTKGFGISSAIARLWALSSSDPKIRWTGINKSSPGLCSKGSGARPAASIPGSNPSLNRRTPGLRISSYWNIWWGISVENNSPRKFCPSWIG